MEEGGAFVEIYDIHDCEIYSYRYRDSGIGRVDLDIICAWPNNGAAP